MKPKLLLLLVMLIFLIGGAWFWHNHETTNSPNQITASGTIETTDIGVGSRVGGRVLRVLFNEGATIKAGDILVTLDPYQLPGQVEQLNAQLLQAQARLAELQHGPRPQEIAAAQAQYNQAQAQASLVFSGARTEDIAQAQATQRAAASDSATAQRNFQRFQTLFQRHVISQQELDTVQNTYQTAQERLNAAQQRVNELQQGNRPQEILAARQQAAIALQQLKLLQAGSRPEDIAAQQATIKAIQAQQQQLQASQKELAVLSPCNCQVSSLNLKPGQLILPNQTLATLTNLNDLWVRVYIPEERFGQVKEGYEAAITVDAFPNRVFKGRVVQLASRAEFTPRNVQTQETRRIQVFGVKVSLDNTSGLLRPGMPADVSFTLHAENP